jgi:hypothetical protein
VVGLAVIGLTACANRSPVLQADDLIGCWRSVWDSDYGLQSLEYCFKGGGQGDSVYIGGGEGVEELFEYTLTGSTLQFLYRRPDGSVSVTREYLVERNSSNLTLTEAGEKREFTLQCQYMNNHHGEIVCR